MWQGSQGLDSSTINAFPAPAQWPELGHDRLFLPTQTYAWMHARHAILDRSLATIIHAVESNGRLVALAPWIAFDGWLRELPALFEPSDLVWEERDSLDTLANDLASQPMPFFLWRVPADSPTIPAIRRAFSGKGMVLMKPAMSTPYIDLTRPGGLDSSLANPKRRSDIRRFERRAGQFGQLTYEIHAPRTEAELLPLMDEVLSVEMRSWKEREGSSITADEWQGDFFLKFAEEAARVGMLRIALLRLDGNPVAVQLAALWRQRFWLFKISHDENFDQCSPGQLLMWHTLTEAKRSGLLSYEFLGGMDSWSRLWTKASRNYVELRVFPFSLHSGKILLRGMVRRLRTQFRKGLD